MIRVVTHIWTKLLALALISAMLGAVFYRQHLLGYFEPKKDDTTRVLVYWDRGIGEQEITERLQIVGERLGIEVRAVSNRPRYYQRWVVRKPHEYALAIFKPDFVLTIEDWIPRLDNIPNYMALTLGTERYLANDTLLNAEHERFDALLPSFQDIPQLTRAFESTGKKFHGFAWYPTSHATDYPAAQPNKLFYAGGFLWDNTRNSEKYRQVFSMLDKTGYFAVCGPKRKWAKTTPNSAVGFIPVDGVKLLDTHHKYGVSLLLHHKLHLDGGAPTGRIFEAAAANTVIISDRHPFIMQHFGDNVLYIDIDEDAEGMFNQIDQHMQWIFDNPEQARQLADNCHKVFLQKFTLEQQVQRLLQMHDSLHTAENSY